MDKFSVEEILRTFFTLSAEGKQTATAARYARVLAQLRLYLETDGWMFLTPDRAALLDLERDFLAENAFARIFDAEDLLYTLHGFLAPKWLLPGLQDRRTQVSLTSRLVQWLCSRALVDRSWHSGQVREVLAAAEIMRRNRGGAA
ncbi:hypothetical protein QMA10_12455 [Arthrobacter sp. APC 3897]|uniref:hypothetical protein n=1 Tax=Arthrobacter sp. APC 3897 TaxID=3035204 RepID=UPI0025B57C19|nr:hypothetical protein [Arthrobacter sp. APC 3897]MDN3482732.1 hypothetical protein [Arthrobacter sp. APC 3897]